MNEKKWHENIPERGMLCKEKSSGSIVRIIGETDHVDFDMVFDDSMRRHVYDPDELTLLTAAEWWDFAPWQDMKDAPLLIPIFAIGKMDFEDGNVCNIVMLHDDEQYCWYKKWLPLPKEKI